MKIKNLLLLLLFSLFLLNVQAVHTVKDYNKSTSITENSTNFKHLKSNVKRSFKALNQVISKKLKRSSLLDNPKRILILAALALIAGVILTLLANIIVLGFIGTLAWLCFIVGFGMVILWIYTILIRA